jgi:hypothetical protein
MAFLQSGNTVIADNDANTVFSNISIQGGALVFTASLEGFGGTVAGYSAAAPGPPLQSEAKMYQKFSFAADSDAVTVGTLAEETNYRNVGYSAQTAGFINNGYEAKIFKVAFANDTDMSWSGIFRNNYVTQHQAACFSSRDHGYIVGGRNSSNSGNVTDMQRWPFLSDANAVGTGTLSAALESAGAANDFSGGNGFILAGATNFPSFSGSTTVNRFPFSSSTPQTNVGNLYQSFYGGLGTSSTTHGYVAGGSTGLTAPTLASTTKIQKFPFAATPGTTGSLVGDLNISPGGSGGHHSSTTHGYKYTGYQGPTPSGNPYYNQDRRYMKYPFASDSNSTTVGNMVQGGAYGEACFMD